MKRVPAVIGVPQVDGNANCVKVKSPMKARGRVICLRYNIERTQSEFRPAVQPVGRPGLGAWPQAQDGE